MEKTQPPTTRNRTQAQPRQPAEPSRKPARKQPPHPPRSEQTYLEERRPEHYAG